MADRIGQQLGNYRLLRLLGEGGFAEVYLGEHSYLGTQAAIKLLYTRVGQSEIGPFQQEARMLANLIHPNIVRVLDFGVEDRTPYLVMDYAPGGSLRSRHPKGSQLPLTTVVEYVKQVAQALQYAHDRKLIHRDIKPENMLIGRNGEILLSDFGIALIAQSSRYQSTKDMAGTITYMAPEQIEAHPRAASDQYSLGIVAYEWLSGTRPFQGSFSEIAIKHTVAPPPPLLAHLPTLPPAVEQVIFTALAKKPEERFASMNAFATALEQASLDTTARVFCPPASQPLVRPVPDTHTLTQSRTITPPNQSAPAHTEPPIPVAPPPLSTVERTPSAPSSRPVTSTPEPQHVPAPSGVSRRVMLIGAMGLATASVIGAGVFWFTRSPTRPPQQDKLFQQNEPFIYRGHNDMVTAVVWSPDGKRIASGSYDKTVQVWNASDGSQPFTYRGHTAPVTAVAWSPDGKRIASGSYDGTVQIWNASNGSQPFTYKGHSDTVTAVAWSPDGRQIASGSNDHTVQVWNASDGSQPFIYYGHGDTVTAVAWSLDGTRIASGSADNTVQVWNARDGSQPFIYRGHKDWVFSVAWEPNGLFIASSSADKTVQTWNGLDGSLSFTYTGHSGAVYAVACSLDGKRIASGSSDQTVQIWNALDESQSFIYRGHSSWVNAVAWSSDKKHVASGSADKTAQVWSAP